MSAPIFKQNLHNHTTFSDGYFEPEKIIEKAIDCGLEGIGISDHFYTPKVFRGCDLYKFLNEIWPVYLDELDRVQELYKRKIRVWRGIEIDTRFNLVGLKFSELPWEAINSRLDFILLEYLGESDIGGMAISKVNYVRKFCKIPVFLAHPNIAVIAEAAPLDIFMRQLNKNGIAIEIPGGRRNTWFWSKFSPQLLKIVSITIGTDTHHSLEEVGEIHKVIEFIKINGLSDRLVDPDSMRNTVKLFI